MSNDQLIRVGDVYRHSFKFSQSQVNTFCEVSGDNNPIHWDEAYAAQTIFKKPIIHGFLGGSVFSKVFGTQFPGEGTIYLRQEMKFMKPMYVETQYEAVLTVKDVNAAKHKGIITTQVFEVATGTVVIEGEAELMHRTRF